MARLKITGDWIARVVGGWGKFVWEIGLAVGDTCNLQNNHGLGYLRLVVKRLSAD